MSIPLLGGLANAASSTGQMTAMGGASEAQIAGETAAMQGVNQAAKEASIAQMGMNVNKMLGDMAKNVV